VWERLMMEFPPEHRHPGKINLAEVAVKTSPETAISSAQNSNPLPDVETEILAWDEGYSLVVQFSQKPYLKSLTAAVRVDDVPGSVGTMLVNLHLELTVAFLLTLPVRFLYWLFRGKIHLLILQSAANLRYEIETGQPLPRDRNLSLPLDGIQIVLCP
jgi:hypothetical protein